MQEGLSYPTGKTIDAFMVNVPGVTETIWKPLYDIQTYPAAGSLSLSFFQRAVGTSGITKAATNMLQAGQIPRGQEFLITGIEVQLLSNEADITTNSASDATAVDPVQAEEYYKVLTNGFLDLQIGSKSYLDVAPLVKCCPRQYVDFEASITNTDSTASTLTSASSGLAQVRGMSFDIVPLLLVANQNFSVTIGFDALETVTTACRLGVTLNGFLRRNAQ